MLCAADAAGFDLCLYAERHLGADFEAWMLAAAISSWTRNIRAMPAVHPGLWHPTLIAKMASCLDRLTTGRMAINVVTGWNEVEARMYGGDILLHKTTATSGPRSSSACCAACGARRRFRSAGGSIR